MRWRLAQETQRELHRGKPGSSAFWEELPVHRMGIIFRLADDHIRSSVQEAHLLHSTLLINSDEAAQLGLELSDTLQACLHDLSSRLLASQNVGLQICGRKRVHMSSAYVPSPLAWQSKPVQPQALPGGRHASLPGRHSNSSKPQAATRNDWSHRICARCFTVECMMWDGKVLCDAHTDNGPTELLASTAKRAGASGKPCSMTVRPRENAKRN